MAKRQLIVRDVTWPGHLEGAATLGLIDFFITKKKFFGGLKEDTNYSGWALVFEFDEHEAITNPMIMDGDIRMREDMAHLIPSTLQSAAMKLREEGQKAKAKLCQNAAKGWVAQNFQ